MGSLDKRFSRDGKAITPFGRAFADAYGVAVQGDGRIVVAGGRSGKWNTEFALVRYTRRGLLDKTFSSDGKLRAGVRATAYSVAIQPDRKIIAAGAGWDGQDAFELMRFLSDGSLDPTFGTNGIVVTGFGSSWAFARDIALQPGGKIVVVGEARDQRGQYFAAARYNSDGSLDPAFGTGGTVLTNFGSCHAGAEAVALQPDGRIVAAGTSGWICDHDIGAFTLVRYRPDGALDSSFGANGRVRTVFPPSNGPAARDVAVQPDGKIVAAGVAEDAGSHSDTSASALVRYNPDGSLDSHFADGGRVITTLAKPGLSSAFSAMALQPDGRILAGGFGQFEEDDFTLARYRPNGVLDASFGARGWIRTDFAGPQSESSDSAYAMALEPNGQVVLAGAAYLFGGVGGTRFAVARYLGRRPSCVVPALTGVSLGHARRLVSLTYCTLASVRWVWSSEVGRRCVISQRPRPHAKRPAGTKVRLVVSRGRKHRR